MEVFDRTLALERLDGNEDRLSDLLDDFRKRIPSIMKAMKKASEKKKPDRFAAEAERLRAASRDIGACGMEALAEQMLEAARSEDFDVIETLLSNMGMELDWLLRILDENRCSGNL